MDDVFISGIVAEGARVERLKFEANASVTYVDKMFFNSLKKKGKQFLSNYLFFIWNNDIKVNEWRTIWSQRLH